MASRLKAEGAIVVPTGGWAMSLTDALGGPTTVTLPAATYYHSSADSTGTYTSLEDALTTLTNAAMGRTWTWNINTSSPGTGMYDVVASGGGNISITWTDTELRDLLGWTGNLSGSIGYTAPEGAEALWRSDYYYQCESGADGFEGWPETDKQDAENAAGYLYSVTGQTKYVNRFRFPMEPRANVITAAESTTNASFQTFVQQAIHGTAPWGQSGGPIRIYPDVDDDATYTDYYVPGFQAWKPFKIREEWEGYWSCEFPRLVKVPA